MRGPVAAMRDTSRGVIRHYGHTGDSLAGAFFVPSPIDGMHMRVIASAGDGWEHVSVSRRNRPPNWAEMCAVKNLFFHPHETVMQLHVPPDEHVNFHPYCLHLWRPIDGSIPRPPAWMVGPREKSLAGGEP